MLSDAFIYGNAIMGSLAVLGTMFFIVLLLKSTFERWGDKIADKWIKEVKEADPDSEYFK